MWAHYDYSNYPNVKVNFEENIKDESEFTDFLNKWLELYKKQQKFTFIFDTTNVGLIHVSYCYKLKKFISQLRQLPNQYLEKSIIIVSNKYIKHLLGIIFKITKPLAKVYIYNLDKEDKKYDINILLDNINNNKIDMFKIVNP